MAELRKSRPSAMVLRDLLVHSERHSVVGWFCKAWLLDFAVTSLVLAQGKTVALVQALASKKALRGRWG